MALSPRPRVLLGLLIGLWAMTTGTRAYGYHSGRQPWQRPGHRLRLSVSRKPPSNTFASRADTSTNGYSPEDQARLFRWRPGTFTPYSAEPQDRDRLGGTLPRWLEEAAAQGREMEALADVRALVKSIVLGQGTSVLAREYGPAIDRFESVFRFNRFEIDGYERFVGTKTTTWVVNNVDIRQPGLPGMRMLREIDRLHIFVPSRKAFRRAKEATERLQSKVDVKIVIFDFGRQMQWKANLNFTATYFSTGTTALIHMMKGAPIAIHGFDFGKGSHGHYFARVAFETCHDVAGEGFLFQQLQRDGVLVPLPCLEAADLEELRRECAIMPLIPPANRWLPGCKKDENRERVDLGDKHVSGDAAIYGTAGLPMPLERSALALGGPSGRAAGGRKQEE